MYTQNNLMENFKKFFMQKTILSRLILINLIVFLIVNLVNLFLMLFQGESNYQTTISPIITWLAVPSGLESLVIKPWTLFTYMFLQESFFHILFNMVMLYFSGKIFLEYLSDKKLLSVYIWGGIFGGLFFIISYNIFPVFNNSVGGAFALGASASVLAILVAVATYVPDYHIQLVLLGRIKLKHLAIAFIIIDLLSIQKGNPGGHIAHIGGAIWGFLYILMLKKGIRVEKFFNIPKFTYNKKGPRKSYSNPNFKSKTVSDDEYNKQKKTRQDNIDAILDKISKSGYSNLSKQEKETLFKMSNKN